ncbi:MAG TPA: oligosaccharide flippase family protein, partial [Saprospiraceae bacterium]|nr:oligosaccharide flippase family protein [Saprospiraceae bacterium]
MQREFSINILFLIGINLLIKPFFIFGIDRVVQNVVGTETYGVYFALLNFTYLLQIINDFGIQNFNNREIARHNQLIHKYFPNILALKGLLSLVFLLAVFLTGWLAGYSAAYFHLLFFLALNQIFISLIFFVRSNIS